MKHFKFTKALALTMGTAMSLTAFSGLVGCSKKVDSLVLMSDALNGLFSPFYSTAGSDMEIEGNTQLSMFTTDANGEVAFGEKEACVALNYELKKREEGTKTYSDYYFVIKNGIKFSDGKPLTINDVLFNLYVFLDPTYAGSSTMYSTEIVGLKDYRLQTRGADNDANAEDALTQGATAYAKTRRNEIVTAFHEIGAKDTTEGSYNADVETMRRELGNANSQKYMKVSDGYLDAVGIDPSDPDAQSKGRQQLIEDYNRIVGDETVDKNKDPDAYNGLFRNELNSDYDGAIGAYKEEPYANVEVRYQGNVVSHGLDDIASFMYYEGYGSAEYPQEVGGTPDRSRIDYIELSFNPNEITTKEAAIDYVYNSTVNTKFDQIMNFWASGTTLFNEFVAKGKEIILSKNTQDGQLAVPNISGIVSMGHVENGESSITIGGQDYTIAHSHNADGTPTNSNEYDVLRITVNGTDPKAIWNFGFTIAPHHYYSDPDLYPVDISNNKFGVEFGTVNFQMSVIQGKNKDGESKNRVPVGAGVYMATNRAGDDLPSANSFIDNNIVYYKANPYFMFDVKTKKLQYHVVSAPNALGAIRSGEVHFVTPQFTKKNYEDLNSSSYTSRGIKTLDAWELGYGYIGVNAGKVTDINLRRAIMAAMDTSLATTYYSSGSAVNIQWPMSAVSWAYPRQNGVSYDGNNPTNGMKDQADSKLTYAATRNWTAEQRKEEIQSYMARANAKKGDSRLKVKFTIAGADLTEHPAYNTMHNAMNLLNECGWDVEMAADPNALIKLTTGSLEVWAAAWGSGLDPDMYQIYHKNSTATSVLAWGYREILGDPAGRVEENRIITELSKLIDDGRRTDDKASRAAIYENAMKKVLELAVELPVYQRKTLYAYNSKVIDESTLAHDPATGKVLINSYSSPLNKIWEVGIVGMDE